MSKTEAIAIDLIRADGGTQMREKLIEEVYMDYRDRWLAGVEFDPVDVFHDGSTYWLADGFHRFYGAREAKRGSIPCRVHQGTLRDAILFACGANSEHGLRRTNEDKRIAVKALLGDPEWGKRSKAWIAETCLVSHPFVEDVIRQHETFHIEKRMGKDGKKRKASNPGVAAANRKRAADKKAAEPAKDGPCPHGGEHTYDSEACTRCHDPVEPDVKGLFKALLEHLRLATLLLDDINRVSPNEKRREDVFQSLECANLEIQAWRKGVK